MLIIVPITNTSNVMLMWRIYSIAKWLEQSCPIASTMPNPAYKVWGRVLHKMKSVNVYWMLTPCAKHFARLARCCGEYQKQKWSLQGTSILIGEVVRDALRMWWKEYWTEGEEESRVLNLSPSSANNPMILWINHFPSQSLFIKRELD